MLHEMIQKCSHDIVNWVKLKNNEIKVTKENLIGTVNKTSSVRLVSPSSVKLNA